MARLRIIPVAAVLVAGAALSACSGTSSSFDPTDWISGDLFSTKTPLPGDRKAVFPEGVPGVEQGVPKELVKGSQQQQQQAAIGVAEPPPAEPEPAKPAAKPAPKPAAAKPAPKPRTASAPPASRPAPQQQPQPSQRPAAASQPTAEWPDGNAVHPPEQTKPANTDANWPPPDSSTFSR